MSAGERRIIHLSLQERSDIVTQSIGRGRDRRIEVFPAEDNDQPNLESDEEFVDDED